MKAAKSGRKSVKRKAASQCPMRERAERYAELIDNSVPWTWDDVAPDLKRSQRRKIRKIAREEFDVPVIPVAKKTKFPAFPAEFIAEDNTNLPQELYGASDSVQFGWLNRDLKSRNPNYDPETQSFPPDTKRYTWHHHQDDGRMQLVEFGVHNATNHKGGRTTWAKGKR